MHKLTKPLPKWIMKKYASLWSRFNGNEFEHSQTIELLGDKHASIILSHLKKNGWIEITLNPDDSRKRFYRLKSPQDAVLEMTK